MIGGAASVAGKADQEPSHEDRPAEIGEGEAARVSTDAAPLGPVQLLVVGLGGTGLQPAIAAELGRLGEGVRVIDMLVIRKDEDGTISSLQHSDLSPDEAMHAGALAGALIGLGMSGGDDEVGEAFAEAGAEAGADGHLLDEDDVWYLEDAIPPGATVAIVLLEHRWAIPLRDALRAADAGLLLDSWIHARDLVGIGLLAAEAAAEH
jgi:hypothetical protein